jgi:hypothetical protein
MAFMGGYVVRDVTIPSGKEPFNGELCRSRSRQTITQLAVLREGQPPSQFRFANDGRTVYGVLKKLPRGIKIAVEATGSWWWFIERQENWETRFLFLIPSKPRRLPTLG